MSQTKSTSNRLSPHSQSTAYQKSIVEIRARMERLWCNLESLKFAEGFNSYLTLLKDISEGKLREDLTAFQKLAEYLRVQQNTVKQATIAKKLKEFSAEYRTNNSESATQAVKQVTTNVENSLRRVQNLFQKFQNYQFRSVDDIYIRIRSYKMMMSIQKKETDAKRTAREDIIRMLRDRNIFTPDEITFLANYSNFWAFCNKIPD